MLIVCERSGSWAVGLRRHLGRCEAPLRETRTLDECRKLLEQSPAAVAILELTAQNFEPLAALLLEIERLPALAVVVGARELAPYGWLLRDAGARHTLFSPRRLGEAVRLAQSHLQQQGNGEQTMRGQVWAQLPWKEFDTTSGSVG